MILHGIEYQRPTSLNMHIMADHVTYPFLAFMKSIFHFCLGCYCGGYSQNGRSSYDIILMRLVCFCPSPWPTWMHCELNIIVDILQKTFFKYIFLHEKIFFIFNQAPLKWVSNSLLDNESGNGSVTIQYSYLAWRDIYIWRNTKNQNTRNTYDQEYDMIYWFQPQFLNHYVTGLELWTQITNHVSWDITFNRRKISPRLSAEGHADPNTIQVPVRHFCANPQTVPQVTDVWPVRPVTCQWARQKTRE